MGLFDLTAVRSAARTLSEQVRNLRAEIEQLRRQRDEIETAPAARADVKAALRRSVETGAERYSEQLQAHLGALIQKPAMLGDQRRFDAAFSLVGAGARGDGTPTVKVYDGMLSAMVGTLICESLTAAVDAMPWPGPEGLPLAQRVAELDRLDRRIVELLAQEVALIAEARSVGLQLEN